MGSGVSTQTVEIQSLSTKDLTGEERLQLERDEEERARDELFDRMDKAHSKLLKDKTQFDKETAEFIAQLEPKATEASEEVEEEVEVELTVQQRFNMFWETLDFDNFNPVTSEILKKILPLDYEKQDMLYTIMRERTADNHRFSNWGKMVHQVIELKVLSGVPEPSERMVGTPWAYMYMERKGYRIHSITYQHFQEVLLAVRDREVELYGVSGSDVWFYDGEDSVEKRKAYSAIITKMDEYTEEDPNFPLEKGELQEHWEVEIGEFVAEYGGREEDYEFPEKYARYDDEI